MRSTNELLGALCVTVMLTAQLAGCAATPSRRVAFSPAAYRDVANLYEYYESQGVEFVFCAYGEYAYDVTVERIEATEQFSTRDSVVVRRNTCPPGMLGIGHSHIHSSCELGREDRRQFLSSIQPATFLLCRSMNGRTYHRRGTIWLIWALKEAGRIVIGRTENPDI